MIWNAINAASRKASSNTNLDGLPVCAICQEKSRFLDFLSVCLSVLMNFDVIL